jgi:two-component system alkaline phosphatase synthesis response regulator PhoP
MPRILVIEDEANIALGLQDDLTLEGYQVEVAGDGEAGSRLAQEGQFDLIILDIMLPKKDGFQICRELRRSGVTTPVLLLTAKTQEAEKVLGLELGADDYVTKPFSPLELRARIKALLRRSQNQAVDVFRFGDCEVHFQKFEVCRAGVPVNLTPIEFKLLSALIRNRGKVLSRDQLLDLVWGADTFITDRVVDTHITNLRKKIEPASGHPHYIINVRGVGYRFDDLC